MSNLQLPAEITVSMFFLWYFFFVINATISYSKDVSRKQILVKEVRSTSLVSEGVSIRMALLVLLTYCIASTINRGVAGYFFFDQLINIDNLNSFFVLLSISYLLVKGKVLIAWVSKFSIPSDYTCVTLSFFLIAPVVSMTPNFYSFFFIIELLGIAMLVKFTFMPMSYSSKNKVRGIVLATPKPMVMAIFTYY